MAPTMTTPNSTLAQADIDLLLAVCEQFGHVDSEKLAEKLGCTTNAAGKRWTRFKIKYFGAKDIGADGGDADGQGQGEGDMTTPKSPKSTGKNGTGRFKVLIERNF